MPRVINYWPRKTVDVKMYIRGCLPCARHGPALRKTPLQPVFSLRPFQLMRMDFIGPFRKTSAGSRYILNLVDYFSRYSIAFATKDNNVEDVIHVLTLVFTILPTFISVKTPRKRRGHSFARIVALW